MPAEFVAARGEPHWPEGNVVLSDHLPPGGDRNFSFDVPGKEAGWWSSLANTHLRTFVPGEYDVRVVVKYAVPPGTDTETDQIAKVTLEPPLSALVWGGVCGSLLLAMFLSFKKNLKAISGPDFRKFLKDCIGLTVGGSLCAWIIILP